MKPRDELSVIVAGQVIADEFRIDYQGEPVATFGADDSGPFPIFRLDFESPEWVGPTVESHLRWSGQGDNSSQLELGTTDTTAGVSAEQIMTASPAYRSTFEATVDQGGGCDARLSMTAAVDGADDASNVTLQAGTSAEDASLSLNAANGAPGSSSINMSADAVSVSAPFTAQTIRESPDTGWLPMTLSAPWANYPGFQTAQYRLRLGRVFLRGLIALGSGSIPPGVFYPITTIPLGYRPPAQLIHPAVSLRTFPGDQSMVQVRATAAGVLNYYSDGGATIDALGWLSLEGISWETT